MKNDQEIEATGEQKEHPEPALKTIFTASEALEKASDVVGVSTGGEGLNQLFYIVTTKNGKLVKQNSWRYSSLFCF